MKQLLLNLKEPEFSNLKEHRTSTTLLSSDNNHAGYEPDKTIREKKIKENSTALIFRATRHTHTHTYTHNYTSLAPPPLRVSLTHQTKYAATLKWSSTVRLMTRHLLSRAEEEEEELAVWVLRGLRVRVIWTFH